MKTLFTVTARALLGIALLLVLTTTASAQKLTGVKKVTDHTSEITLESTAEGTKVDYTGHTNAFAGIITGKLANGSIIKFYCIDLNHTVSPSSKPVYWDEGATPEALTYILNNYFPVNANAAGKLSSLDQEAAAVQLAIWHFSDSLDPNSISDETIKLRTKAIIADANANAGNSNPLQTLQIIPVNQSVPQGGTASFTVKAVSINNTAISGLSIQLTTTGGTLNPFMTTTGTNGITPTITLTNGNNTGTFVVTAKATVTLPHGTIYVAKVGPTTHQRLVLATPTSGVKEVTTTIVFSQKPSTCDLTKFTTYTQGGWGSPSNSTPGGIRDAHFASVFPNGLTVGGNYSIKFTSATAVMNFPAGSAAAALTTNYVNPTTKINVLASQLVALSLNVAYSNAGYLGATTYPLGSLFIVSGTFAGKTVNQFLTIANNALGGATTGYTLSDINTAATAINENFDDGTVNKNYLSCTTGCANKIGSYVYRDSNINGTKDSGEAGIAGVVVELLQGSTLISTATTDVNGSYSFNNLSNASYTVRIAASNFVSGGVFFNTNQIKWYTKGNGAIGTTLNCNDILSINFGYWKTCVGVTKTADKTSYTAGEKIQYTITVENCGDIQLHGGVDVFDALLWGSNPYHIDIIDPGKTFTIPAANTAYTVKATDCGKNITNTVRAEGHPVNGSATVIAETSVTVSIVCEEPKASLGDKVWIDANKNGIQDNGEVGKSGVTVKLFTCTTNTLVGTTTTNSNGLYLFNNLNPGNYYVEFTKPAGFVFTTKDAGADAVDSDVDVTTGKTTCITLAAGQNDLTWDAGIYEQIASLGDKVWEDTDKDGIQDTDENGISGVTVKLFTCANVEVATTTTDGNGNYLFSNLASGSYYVKFEKPAGYLFTGMDAGTDNVDSDVNATTGKTICIELSAGENDLTWDAGVYKAPVIDKADLKIEKSASKINPSCGDNFFYTIKVTNLGPNSAANVVVNDLLPNGIDYVSNNTSVGSFDNTSGAWTIGTLLNNTYATLTINVKVNCGNTNSSFDLGVAKDFNLFVLEDLYQQGTDTQGKLAVGNNAILSDYSVGDQLPANSGDVLVVGNNLSFTSGDIFGGNVVYGNATNLPEWSVTIGGTLTKGTPINFASATIFLQTLSTTLGGFTVNGTTKFEWGGLKLTGTNPTLNIFKVNGSNLSVCNDMQITVPTGSVVVVNISGTDVSWKAAGLEVHGTAITNVLYNFYQATKLTIADIDVRGSLLAPYAALKYNSGVINGQVVVKSMKGDGQFNLSTFLGTIPAGKVLTNVAVVTSSTLDEVMSNNIASASITVSGSINNNNSGTTDVEDETGLPKEFKLNQNYPNPFNPSTIIEFSIPAAGSYSLKVYDIIGQEVATLVNSNLSAGNHRVNFDAGRLASGMYIYQLFGNNINITRKMLLTK